jgi:hypothetical protein
MAHEGIVHQGHDVSLDSVIKWHFSYTRNLPSAVTVVSAIATLELPDGTRSAVAGGNVTVATPDVYVKVGPFSTLGRHAVCLESTYTDGQIVPQRLEFEVIYDPS